MSHVNSHTIVAPPSAVVFPEKKLGPSNQYRYRYAGLWNVSTPAHRFAKVWFMVSWLDPLLIWYFLPIAYFGLVHLNMTGCPNAFTSLIPGNFTISSLSAGTDPTADASACLSQFDIITGSNFVSGICSVNVFVLVDAFVLIMFCVDIALNDTTISKHS